MEGSALQAGTLYVVATPIGNLEDITLRALQVLRTVDLIAAEDTRYTRKLLNHFDIQKNLLSYFEHNKFIRGPQCIKLLEKGKNIALLSNAGTPCISDPGYHLVNLAIEKGLSIIPVPGACAMIASLSIAGLPTHRFVFEGFPPRKKSQREELFVRLKGESGTVIFYESPRRLFSTLSEIYKIWGNRPAVICRELTKIHEEALRGFVSVLLDSLQLQTIRGEVTLLVGGAEERGKGRVVDLEDEIRMWVQWQGLGVKQFAAELAKKYNRPSKEIYRIILGIKEGKTNN